MSKTKGTKGETDSLKLDGEFRLTQEEFSRVAIGGDDLLAGQRYRDLVTVPHLASVFAGTVQGELLSTRRIQAHAKGTEAGQPTYQIIVI